MGMQIGHRMTIVRLRSGALLVHSPVDLNPGLQAEVEGLGPVGFVVSPSLMHDLWLAGWLHAYPGAAFLAPPSFGARGGTPRRPEVLRETMPAWEGDIDVVPLGGAPRVNEVAMFHRASRTLLVADLVFNLSGGPWLSRIMLRLNGVYGRLGPSRLFRSVIRDRRAFRASLDQVLAWDFDRLVPGHGAIVESGARAALASAFDWL